MTRGDLEAALRAVWGPSRPAVIHPSARIPEGIEGGAAAVCEAILGAAGSFGTVLVPAFTATETVVGLSARAVPFRPDMAVSARLGPVPEAFRRLPGVVRSAHPSHSFAAWGPAAGDLLATHRDDNPLGPLKKLNVARGTVILLGAGIEEAMAIHLAEETSPRPYLGRAIALRINSAGFQERIVIHRFPRCSRAFGRLEERIESRQWAVAESALGTVRSIPVRELVRVAAAALRDDPAFFVCGDPQCEGCRIRRQAAGGA